MLDAFIIEELKKQSDEFKRDQRPVLELPLDEHSPEEGDTVDEVESDGHRGVIIIDYGA
jgi:hypothetical protein